MNLVQWSPFREMEDFFDRYRRLAAPSADDSTLDLLGANIEWRPVADITENKKAYVIKADLPEVKKKDIVLEVDGGYLTISGERRSEQKTDEDKHHRVETFYGKFSRSFRIPDDVEESKISADCADGVLRVTLPKAKKPAATPKRIDVQ